MYTYTVIFFDIIENKRITSTINADTGNEAWAMLKDPFRRLISAKKAIEESVYHTINNRS